MMWKKKYNVLLLLIHILGNKYNFEVKKKNVNDDTRKIKKTVQITSIKVNVLLISLFFSFF
jgi:hypothetical protein